MFTCAVFSSNKSTNHRRSYLKQNSNKFSIIFVSFNSTAELLLPVIMPKSKTQNNNKDRTVLGQLLKHVQNTSLIVQIDIEPHRILLQNRSYNEIADNQSFYF